MKFNYVFEFAPIEGCASRQVEVIINGTEPKIVDCDDNKVTIELAINERLTLNLINNDDKGEQMSKRIIIADHIVIGAKFEPETLQGTTIKVTKVGEEEAPSELLVEAPAPPTDEVPLTQGGFPKQSTEANPDASV